MSAENDGSKQPLRARALRLVGHPVWLVLSTALILIGVSVAYRSDARMSEHIDERQQRLFAARRMVGGISSEVLSARLMQAALLTRDAEPSVLGLDRVLASIRHRLEQFGAESGEFALGDDVQAAIAGVDEAGEHFQSAGQLMEILGLRGSVGAIQRFDRSEQAIATGLSHAEPAWGLAFGRLRVDLREFLRSFDMGTAGQLLKDYDQLIASLRRDLDDPELLDRIESHRQELSVFARSVLRMLRTEGKGRLALRDLGPRLAGWDARLESELEAVSARARSHRRSSMGMVATVVFGGLLVLWMLFILQRRASAQMQRRARRLAEAMDRFAETGEHPAPVGEPAGEGDQIGQLEAQFARMSEQLQQQMDMIRAEQVRADEASRVKSQFLANVSHEIRTPMNGVLGMLQLLERTDLTSDQQEFVSTIRASGDGLLALISDLLDYSKIEAGRLDLECVGFDVAKLVRSLASLMTPIARERGLEFDYSVPEGLPMLVDGDPVRLRQVLTNLIGNAIKFTHEGSVRLLVEGRVEPDGYVTLGFLVRDTGIGIREEHMQRLFEPFNQGDPSTTRRFGGTGLGLSISQRLVDMMGGQLVVSSEEGKGSEFGFALTLCRAENELVDCGGEPAAGDTLQEEVRIAERLPARILLAEDNAISRRVATKILERFGYEIDVAENGVEALELVTRRGFDVVLMDMQMPEMDGVEATRRIRDADVQPRPWIVALTANASRQDRATCIDAGMDDFLSKPITVSALVQAIERWGASVGLGACRT